MVSLVLENHKRKPFFTRIGQFSFSGKNFSFCGLLKLCFFDQTCLFGTVRSAMTHGLTQLSVWLLRIASIHRSRPLPDMVSFFSAGRKRKQTLPELATSLLTSLPDLPFGDVKLCLDLRIDARLSIFSEIILSGSSNFWPLSDTFFNSHIWTVKLSQYFRSLTFWLSEACQLNEGCWLFSQWWTWSS